ncbi:SDR family NAD(P)-dependent oxidoreductase [Geothrix terrae]|uniref:SDR family NAD(P)-dependent oxidoreductase n=1 Tax=Geothrix terrae TaxID=2922720 RepID=UPI001FAB408C|nr:SDR family oxidoreductase [Geothrix terrae]
MPAPNGTDFTPTVHHDTYPAIDPSQHASFRGRHVFITGASRGIGRATARAFAKAGAAAIALGARSDLHALEQELREVARVAHPDLPPPRVVRVPLDVADPASVQEAAARLEEALEDRLDLLINNAGYLEASAPLAESDPDEWWKAMTINLRGPYLVTRALLPLLLQGGDRTVVNTSSIGAHHVRPGASGYQTSKLALLRLTEFLAAEYADQGLLAYAIHPGGVLTELGSRMPAHTHAILVDTPELAGDTLAFLASERRDWLSGRYVSVNWDMGEFLARAEEIVRRDLLKVRMAV